MLRGISGGQRKRLTTGEMLVGPARALFMDEISTGLDSSTTFQIVNALRHYIHILCGTAVVSLLQPAPETYDLFDDMILLSDGQVVYQGPCEHVPEFFESVGFKCPKRKGVADFLQEVTSKRNQKQYWVPKGEPYHFIPVREFAEAFKFFHVGQKLGHEVTTPFDKNKNHPAAMMTKKYGITKKELLKACISREHLLIKRNSFVYIFKSAQLLFMAFVSMTLFLQTEMSRDNQTGGLLYLGALFFTLTTIMFSGLVEINLTLARLPVFFKQRDHLFYPSWAFSLPAWILKIPFSFIEDGIWLFTTYCVMGFDPSVERLFRQYILLVLVSQMASGLFQLAAGVARDIVVAITFGLFALLVIITLGGYILSRAFEKSQAVLSEEPITGNDVETSSGGVEIDRSISSRFTCARREATATANQKKSRMEMKVQGVGENRLELLKSVSGAFRPGVLTALMGVSGAGKTTLMDVLAGRKTGGYIDGNITIAGYPKKQETFARISGYCEQNEIHSPHVTVYESLVYSSWLRLAPEVDSSTRKMFIEVVMELVELFPLREAIVGLPGTSGLSTEQRKRLMIAVELVANASIIFMDEPTSGLDARAAAIVMRTVRNTVDTGRTVVCTIHQPSINIFDAFDELLLLKRGREEIYVGPLGHNSCHLINYLEGINGVRKISEGYNPATWMMEVTNGAQEVILNIDFADV